MKTGIPLIAMASAVLAFTITPGAALADIYRYTDKDGNVVFSDKPPADQSQTAEPVELGTTNRAAPPPEIPRPAPQAGEEMRKVRYTSTITSPSDGTTIPMGPGNFAVTAMLSPPLNSDERAVLLLDGSPVGEPQRSSSWQLQNVFRGEHQLVVERRDNEGRARDRSLPVTVYVLRPSIR